MRPVDPTDVPLEAPLRDAAQAYNQPPADVPREAMWRSIQAARRQRRATPPDLPTTHIRSSRRWTPVWGWPLTTMTAAAVMTVLASGVVVGRWAHEHRSVTPASALAAAGESRATGRQVSSRPRVAYDVALTRNLAQAEALLTAYESGGTPATDRDADAAVTAWARDVLSNTRLLLDSPAAIDPRRRRLLEDLEVVLVQIVAPPPMSATDSKAERQMIDTTLQRQHVMTRLRNAVPAGAVGI